LGIGGPLHSCGADDFAYFTEILPALMLFVGVGDGSSMRLHDHQFLPPDATVRSTARALLAGYLAAAEISGERMLAAAHGGLACRQPGSCSRRSPGWCRRSGPATDPGSEVEHLFDELAR
jgi:hypothetical protein